MIDRKHIFVDGQWIPSTGTEVLTVINPVTEEPIATVPRGTAEDADKAVRAASRAFPRWRESTVDERVEIFGRLASLTEKRADELTRAMVSELGYPAGPAHQSQSVGAVEELQVMAASLRQIQWTEQIGATRVRREPSGVLGAITAWNGPLRSVISKAGAAIAAGCTAVVKGSEVAPLSTFLFAEITAEAGLPPGVFNLLSGTGPEVGEAIASHPLVDMVSLTGSVRAGSRVMELASASVKRCHLELGGKSANLICEDADLERAVVDGLEDAMRNTGQVCGGLTRVLVPRSRLADAEAIAVGKAESYRMGDPWDPATTLGPVSTAAARERVRGYIRSGQEQGARMLCGGTEAPDGLPRGWFVRPTVFSGDNRMRISREEIFGPVVVLIPYDDEAQAIDIANDSLYGLAGAVWCADPERARAIATRLRTGRVRINGGALTKHGTHGGFKLSGYGREWGRFGVEEFLEYQSLYS
jgi:aldehyde dehydrogenase (NAD+)